MQIKNENQYLELLEKFKNKLVEKIPKKENPEVWFEPPHDPLAAMQYGSSAVICNLSTKSSGVDKYLIFVDQNGNAKFIRNMVW